MKAFISFKDPGVVNWSDLHHIEQWLQIKLGEEEKKILLGAECDEFKLQIVPCEGGEIWLLSMLPIAEEQTAASAVKLRTFNKVKLINTLSAVIDKIGVRRELEFDHHSYINSQKSSFHESSEMELIVREFFKRQTSGETLSQPLAVTVCSDAMSDTCN